MKGIYLAIFMGIALAALLLAAGADEGQNIIPNLTVNQSSSQDENISSDQRLGQSAEVSLGSGDRNAGKVLRAGLQEEKAVVDLDMYGNRSVHVIPPQDPAQWAFDISQRVGNISKFDFFRSYKPILSISPHFRMKANYQPPSNLSSRPVYSISGYPRIKIASAMP